VLIERWYGDKALLPLRLFRGRTFAVASSSSVILGMSMVNGLLVLPLYQQIVKGASPTMGGLVVLPAVLGIMAGAVLSGQIIFRTGRYRLFPIFGSLLMLIAPLLFSRVGADTPLWRTMVVMVVMGLGLGGNIQPMVTATQNSVGPREIGVATSAVTFFRSMGNTLGAAVFLSILFTTLPDKIKAAFTAASQTLPFRQGTMMHPEQMQALQVAASSGTSSSLNDTSFINRLAAPLAHRSRSASPTP
jgi:MFS family permease